MMKEAFELCPVQWVGEYLDTYLKVTIDMANSNKIMKDDVNNVYQRITAIINNHITLAETEKGINIWKGVKDNMDYIFHSYQYSNN